MYCFPQHRVGISSASVVFPFLSSFAVTVTFVGCVLSVGARRCRSDLMVWSCDVTRLGRCCFRGRGPCRRYNIGRRMGDWSGLGRLVRVGRGAWSCEDVRFSRISFHGRRHYFGYLMDECGALCRYSLVCSLYRKILYKHMHVHVAKDRISCTF